MNAMRRILVAMPDVLVRNLENGYMYLEGYRIDADTQCQEHRGELAAYHRRTTEGHLPSGVVDLLTCVPVFIIYLTSIFSSIDLTKFFLGVGGAYFPLLCLIFWILLRTSPKFDLLDLDSTEVGRGGSEASAV